MQAWGVRITLVIGVAVASALPDRAARAAEPACGADPGDAAAMAVARDAIDDACECETAASRRTYKRCARALVKRQTATGQLRRRCSRAVLRCALRSTCGREGAVTCCRTNADGGTRCVVESSAAKCRAPRGGSACADAAASCCDACEGGCALPSSTSTSTTTSSTSLPASSTTTSTSTSTTSTVATPCGEAYPTCNGSCPPGEQCWPDAGFPPSACECLPVGVVPCSSSEFSTCGGTCPGGDVCGPIAIYTIEFGTMLACACLDPAADCSGSFTNGMCPGLCEPGWVCVGEPEPAGLGGCVGCLPEGIVVFEP